MEGTLNHHFLTLQHHSGLDSSHKRVILTRRFSNQKWAYSIEPVFTPSLESTTTIQPDSEPLPTPGKGITQSVVEERARQKKQASQFSVKHLSDSLKMTEVVLKKPFFFSSTNWVDKKVYSAENGELRGLCDLILPNHLI